MNVALCASVVAGGYVERLDGLNKLQRDVFPMLSVILTFQKERGDREAAVPNIHRLWMSDVVNLAAGAANPVRPKRFGKYDMDDILEGHHTSNSIADSKH